MMERLTTLKGLALCLATAGWLVAGNAIDYSLAEFKLNYY